MASTKTVSVLAPNGRRQNVKVTPNTTILQILEEVCKKQGFKPEEYDIKHHNHVLDVSSILRFSGLPNNAQLEMCSIQKIREETAVVLGIQLENGTRLQGNYFPNENLWNILTQLCPDEIKPDKNPVVIYMRQEIHGPQALQTTSLKSLGLTSGRAMLRLLHRKPEELRTQANVSAPLPSKPPEEREERPYVRKIQRLESEPEQPKPEPKPDVPSRNDRSSFSPPKSPKSNKNTVADFIKKEKSKKSLDSQKIKSSVSKKDEPMDVDSAKSPDVPEIDFTFLGERNALAFSLDMAQTVPHEDLPDEFFELTIKDARKLLKDLKQKREEIEECPLQTSTIRNFEKDKKILRHLNQYKKSIIRVQFPDRTVLQGTFKPLETIDVVKNFVKEYLQDPGREFYLYTTPPKEILQPSATLLDADCVPSAVVHFGLVGPVDEDFRYLKENILSKFISHSLASIAAARSRGNEVHQVKQIESSEDIDMCTNESIQTSVGMNANAGPSSAGAGTSTSYSPPPARKTSGPKEKVPKWFKPN